MAVKTTAIIDLAEIMEHMPDVLDTEVKYLERLINAASDRLEHACHRPFISRSFLRRFDGTGDQFMVIPEIPVVSVSAVSTYSADEVETALTTVQFKLIDPRAGILKRIQGIWPKGKFNVEITYTAGLAATKAEIPDDLKQAVKILVSQWFVNRDGAVESRIGDISTSYGKGSLAWQEPLPTEIAALISSYVRESW